MYMYDRNYYIWLMVDQMVGFRGLKQMHYSNTDLLP